ncbi:MAG: urease accessory UreF family protein [Nitrospirota bacterium]
MNTSSLLKGLRFVDSFFPSGGYAFSSGLEAAVQGGAVRNAEELSRYVVESLTTGMGEREAVTVGIAHEAYVSGVLDMAFKTDKELEAMKLGRESRTASRQMGRQVMRLAANQLARQPLIEDYLAVVEAEQTPGHLAVSLGLTLAAAGWSKEDTIAAFLYHTATGYVAAAMKLLPIGQREGQRLLESWLEVIERVSLNASHQQVLQSWSPIQDIYAMRHSRLESRLFRS